jgi:Na+-transporting NADH:ubiquinone oxidoreductase subunit NqrF
MEDGEVPPYLVDDARPGDQFELRGPIGGYFVWDARQQRPLVLIAGGSGLVLRASGVAVQLTLTREAAPPADRPDASTRRINREMLEAPETR